MYLSVVIPAYNEEKRISSTLQLIWDYLQTKEFQYEVIVIDDGSSDSTVIKAETSMLFTHGKLKVLVNGINRGKGFSVRRGILDSAGEYVLICDADLSTPIEELDKLFIHMQKGCDVVIGSRSAEISDVRVRQPWYREKMGKIFNIFVKIFLGLKNFNDTQCGFKLLRSAPAREIARDMKIDGFCFDVEMLYLALGRGCSISEVGVVWCDAPNSKVKIMASSVNMFYDLFKIKRLHK